MTMSTTVSMPHARFNRHSTSEQVTEGCDLTGKTILITGVNSGLGFESLRVLCKRGAHVIAVARTLAKAQQACAQVEGTTTPVACELSDLASVAACADEVKAMGLPIDVLLCNAGIMALPELQVKYGLEMQFLTNHLGHFLLVNRLLDRVKEAEAGRIVVVTSMGHMQAKGLDLEDLSGAKGYDGWQFYYRSKLANVLMSNELARRLAGTRVTSNSVHPGVIRTNLSRSMTGFTSALISFIVTPFQRTIAQGAATQCYVAAHPDLDGVTGSYFVDCKVKKPSKDAQDVDLARRLWDKSEALLADYL